MALAPTRGSASKWLKRVLIALAVVLAIAAAVPFFISADDYIPQIETGAAARLKDRQASGK